MRILSVAPYVPYAGIPHAGGSYLLRHLQEMSASGNDVALLVPGIPEQLAHVADAPDWLELVMGPHVIEGRTLVRRLRDAVYRRAMNSPPAPTAESIRSVVSAGLIQLSREADVVELHWAEYARFASILRRAGIRKPIAIVEHDVELHLAAERIRAHTRGYRRTLALLTAPLARHKERRGLIDADLVLCFKSADEQTLRAAGVGTAVQVIDPWLDEPHSEADGRLPRSVLFAGALWRPENEDAVVWFLQNVWPQVNSAVPAATFAVVGAQPTDRLRQVAREYDGVEVIADVADLVPYYQRASLFVAPLFAPGGLKFKVPQAMLCGLPVVATTVAAEGIVGVAPPDALWKVTDDASEMAASIIMALDEPAQAAAVGLAAQAWCVEFYSFSGSIARLLDSYRDLAAQRSSP
ncbi:MAG: hypothetical protein QOG69_339 [Actinomycetota bacterium]|nr:hypothetical protein [Actinomycetota bacterium]